MNRQRTITEESTVPGWAPEKPRLRVRVEAVMMRAAGRTAAGLNALFGSRAGCSLGILTYHRTADPVAGLPRPFYNVEPRRFRRQLAGLLARGFRAWPLERALDQMARGGEIPPRTFAVTFDDGFGTVYRRAWPVLQELEVPATVFLSTAYLDSTEPFPFDAWGIKYRDAAPPESYRPLTVVQCREMAAEGSILFGAHTHSHRDYRRRPQAFQRDLQTSVDIVRSLFRVGRVTSAFPYGNPFDGFAGGELALAARRTGVACALTTEPQVVGTGCDPFHWGRFNVFDWDTAATLAGKLEGWYSWAPRMRKRVARTGAVAIQRLRGGHTPHRHEQTPHPGVSKRP